MELIGSTELPGLGTLRLFRAALCGTVLAPGQELFGTVEFQCLKPSMFVRGVWVKLMGRQSLTMEPVMTAKLDLLEGQEDYYLGGFHDVLYGFGEEDESGGTLFELREGLHRWNYAFKIPESAPPSYCDEYMDVSYSATVVFDSPEVPIAISQITHTAIVTASVVDATSSRILAAANCGDIDALGVRPSVAFETKKTSGLWSCMQPDSSVSMATSEDVAAILDAVPARLVTSLDLNNGISRNNSRPSSHGAHTVLRLMLSKDDRNFAPSSSGTIAPMPVAFDFTFMETSVKVDCSIATMCTGKICLEARLLVCINLRSDQSRPFRSLRSLLQAPSSLAKVRNSASVADSDEKGLRMHILRSIPKSAKKMAPAGGGLPGAVRRWLGRLTPSAGDSERGDGAAAEGWGACIVHPLWSRAVSLQAPEQPLSAVTVQLEVPVKIDPTVRSTCLADWPRPSPLLHQAHGAILNFTTRDTPLFQYRVMLEVAAFELMSDADNGRGKVAAAGLERSVKKQLLCQPCYAEIEINAPGPSRPASAAPAVGAHRNRRAPGPFSPMQAAPTHDTATDPTAGVGDFVPGIAVVACTNTQPVPAPVPAPARRPRHRHSGAARRTVAPSMVAGDVEDSSSAGVGIGIAGAGAGATRVRRAVAVPNDAPTVVLATATATMEAADTGAEAVPCERPRPRHRHNHSGSEAVRAIVDGENSDPNIVAASSMQDAAGKRKPQTPQARVVKSLPKVRAELVSRGPAAVLRDRTAPVHRDIHITPQRFAPAVPIAQGAVVVLDDTTSVAMGAQGQGQRQADRQLSTRATTTTVRTCAPEAGFRGTDTDTCMFSPSGGEGFSPSQVMSPTLAFLCSPRTTEILLQQEREEQEQERMQQESAARAATVVDDDYYSSESEGDDDDANCCDTNYAGDEEGRVAVAELTMDDLPRRPPLAAPSTTIRQTVALRGVTGGEAGATMAASQTPHTRLLLEDGVHLFQLPPDTAPPSARERIVRADTEGIMDRGSPWVDGGAAGLGIHFTHNCRRLSFSHPTEDLVSEFQPLPFNSPIPT